MPALGWGRKREVRSFVQLNPVTMNRSLKMDVTLFQI
jgi:hypothetical protein